MGIASLVIGIVSLAFGIVPFCCFFTLIPALVGFVLGIVDVTIKSRRKLPKGLGVAGIVLNSTAILIIVLWGVFLSIGAIVANGKDFTELKKQIKRELFERSQPQPEPLPAGQKQAKVREL